MFWVFSEGGSPQGPPGKREQFGRIWILHLGLERKHKGSVWSAWPGRRDTGYTAWREKLALCLGYVIIGPWLRNEDNVTGVKPIPNLPESATHRDINLTSRNSSMTGCALSPPRSTGSCPEKPLSRGSGVNAACCQR